MQLKVNRFQKTILRNLRFEATYLELANMLNENMFDGCPDNYHVEIIRAGSLYNRKGALALISNKADRVEAVFRARSWHPPAKYFEAMVLSELRRDTGIVPNIWSDQDFVAPSNEERYARSKENLFFIVTERVSQSPKNKGKKDTRYASGYYLTQYHKTTSNNPVVINKLWCKMLAATIIDMRLVTI